MEHRAREVYNKSWANKSNWTIAVTALLHIMWLGVQLSFSNLQGTFCHPLHVLQDVGWWALIFQDLWQTATGWRRPRCWDIGWSTNCRRHTCSLNGCFYVTPSIKRDQQKHVFWETCLINAFYQFFHVVQTPIISLHGPTSSHRPHFQRHSIKAREKYTLSCGCNCVLGLLWLGLAGGLLVLNLHLLFNPI